MAACQWAGVVAQVGADKEISDPMEVTGIGQSVDSLLEELHEKKRWLDMMIKGLEAALDSPEHRLIQLAERTFDEDQEEGARVDLEQGKAALTSLARSVGRTPNARRLRSERGRQAVKT